MSELLTLRECAACGIPVSAAEACCAVCDSGTFRTRQECPRCHATVPGACCACNAAWRPVPTTPARSDQILTLGILSFLSVLFCLPASPFLGVSAWMMANTDLGGMSAGRLSSEGRSSVVAGKVLGIVGTFLGAAVFLGCSTYLLRHPS